LFQQIFDTRVRDLWNLYEATGELQHSGEKGLLREIFLRRLFESVLPSQFAVGSGIVVDKWKRQSPQVDLVIFDRRRLPPIFEEHGHGIYPVDTVLRVIEVKSTLDKLGLDQFMRLAQMLNPANPEGLKIAAKGTLEGGLAYYPFAALFAYKTTLGNISETQKELGGFEGLIAPICVATRSVAELPNSEMEQNIRVFLTKVLDAIEASANSRKPFSVVEWLFG
jgi:hypothetical protein